MNISIFDVLGPVMIGPSSSHTAGAARLGRAGMQLAGGDIVAVSFGLSGSFSCTHIGHGTDRALVAGALGLREDDERLPNAFALAAERGLKHDFYEIDLNEEHENAVKMTFQSAGGGSCDIVGCSIGGGRIRITRIDAFRTEIAAELPTLVVLHEDRRGIISEISSQLAQAGINIAIMRLTREARGGAAAAVFETDEPVSEAVRARIAAIDKVSAVRMLAQ